MGFWSDLQDGKRYEQFVYDKLRQNYGVTVVGTTGHNNDENNLGLEIKFDRKVATTGNLYIETADRQGGGGGIFRDSNSKWFWIGDYSQAWIFRLSTLRELVQTMRYRMVATPTSAGMLLPVSDADAYSVGRYRKQD